MRKEYKFNKEVKSIFNFQPSWLILNANIFILMFISIVILLSIVIKYPEKISGQIKISSSTPAQKLYSNINSKIKGLYLKDGEKVSAGEVIAELSNSANYKDVIFLKNILKENNFLDSLVLSSIQNLSLGNIESSFINFENAVLDYQIFKKENRYDIKKATKSSIVENNNISLNNLLNKRKLILEEKGIIYKDLARNKSLFDKGVISKSELELKELEYLKTKNRLNNINVEIANIEKNRKNSDLDNKFTDLDEERENLDKKNRVKQTLNILLNEIFLWEEKNLFISKLEGSLFFTKELQRNDYIEKNDFLFSVVPSKKGEIKAFLKVDNFKSGKIKLGQRVNIFLENYPFAEYGILVGEIIRISQVPDKDNKILISIRLPNGLNTTYNKQLEYSYNMKGKADIITEDISILERVFFKLKNILKNKQ